jgi:DNA-binding response OmpR family regulator
MSAGRDGSGTVETPMRSSRGEPSATAPEENPDAREQGSAPALLIIDDDRDVREILSHYFTAKGFLVETAESGEGIFETLERLKPRVLLLDLMLPGEDGHSILIRLRGSATWSRLPVIMITAAHNPGTLEPLREGTDGWFEKPLDLSALQRHVQRLLARQDPPDRSSQPPR